MNKLQHDILLLLSKSPKPLSVVQIRDALRKFQSVRTHVVLSAVRGLYKRGSLYAVPGIGVLGGFGYQLTSQGKTELSLMISTSGIWDAMLKVSSAFVSIIESEPVKKALKKLKEASERFKRNEIRYMRNGKDMPNM